MYKRQALQEQAAYDSRKKAQRDSRKAQDDRYSAEDDVESRDMARELEDERKRNKALESVNRRLREQMKVTPPGTADPASLRMAAKRLSEEMCIRDRAGAVYLARPQRAADG